MALLFCDSFDHYATGDMGAKYKASAPGTGASITSSGRFGSCFEASDTHAYGGYQWGTNPQTLIFGCALLVTGSQGSGRMGIMALYDGGTNQIDLRLNSINQLILSRNNTLLNTGATILSNNVWYYVECKVKIATGTSGTYEVRLNGVAEFSSGAANTSGAGTTQANILYVNGNKVNSGAGGYSGPVTRIDDLYLCDSSGSVNNDFLGDIRVEALFPNGNGNSSQFTGSDGNSTDNYLLVDESTPNGDTDYVADATVGDKDTYAFTNPTPTSGSVFGVQICHYSRKTDAGTRSARSLARLSGTDADNGSDQALSTSYLYYCDMRETKPGGGSWSLSDVSSAEFGVKVAA